ncbi:TadE/TadG family type IV pilus assembly protein [Vannielia litorea]|uniref:TadE/TadG family type IV pilus assembly protein n=1 Tax=Vannielia litorea TaxID=1217970 RepID=UPI001BCAF402|nr:TadE family protein [Vannielia litorea]MBS8225599.1 pilus assembly protein [Vannielia litorea]
MTGLAHIIRRAGRFTRDTRGAALVEFAISLPLMLLIFAVTIEGGRLFWAYQTTASGVRDAARYLARIAPEDACATPGDFSGYTARMEQIVRETSSGNSLFPSSITVTAVAPELLCQTVSYSASPIAVAQVTATLEVTFPFGGIFGLMDGLQDLDTITTTLRDQSRVFGS